MKQLVCEMCGSTELIKQDGVFVCQSCGIKYSVEEARKMMIEGTVEVSGVVKVDDTAKIANYYTMAENAYEAGNKQEAENYCNKIIEIEPSNYKAWLLKGSAAGWQSTLARLRIDEAVNCFTKAVDFAPEEQAEEVKSIAAKETTSLTSALLTMCCNHFAERPSERNAKDVVDAAILMKRIGLTLLIKCGAKADDLSKQLATTINNAAMDAWNHKVYPDYAGEEHPSRYVWERFIEQGDAVISMLKTSVSLCDDDDEGDAIRYSNLIAVETKICDSASYKYDSTWHWQIDYQLSAAAKSTRNAMIMEWHTAWNKIDPSHSIPSTETISGQTSAKATAETNNNFCVCIATIIIVVVAIVWGFLS